MPRRHRLWFSGAKYHITSRGIRKSALFYDDQDRRKYLSLLEEVKTKFPYKIYAYCLMTNHIHLQIETIDHSPSVIMKQLHTQYAKYFNKKYDFTGHVFESRYGAELIDTLDYELEVHKYIHLNPLRANLVDHLEDYPWSSYRTYLLGEENPLVSTDHIFSYFSNPLIKNYRKYINAPHCYLVFLPNGKVEYHPKENHILLEILNKEYRFKR
ncbi:transposase [Heyndrickxia sp. NPDC080065]|uniref:transposase n=1 Tax=Heyndrickxia sp. NPDC080065 TaxID=3390568 RepID=UPI003D07F18F